MNKVTFYTEIYNADKVAANEDIVLTYSIKHSQSNQIANDLYRWTKQHAAPVNILFSELTLWPLGINAITSNDGDVKIYPNPTNNSIHIESPFEQMIQIAIVNEDGLNNDALEAARILPAGPMRESINRLNTVDAIVCNGQKTIDSAYEMPECLKALPRLRSQKSRRPPRD